MHLLSGDEDRTSCLEIQIEKCSKDNKKAVIVTRSAGENGEDEFPLDPTFDYNIDEVSFCLHDKSVSSSDAKFVSDQGRPAPYSPPEADGSFSTPIKGKKNKPCKPSDSVEPAQPENPTASSGTNNQVCLFE